MRAVDRCKLRSKKRLTLFLRLFGSILRGLLTALVFHREGREACEGERRGRWTVANCARRND